MNQTIEELKKKLDWLEINPENLSYQLQNIRLLLNKLEQELEGK
jgi:hypothetical protein